MFKAILTLACLGIAIHDESDEENTAKVTTLLPDKIKKETACEVDAENVAEKHASFGEC